jgi:hypothetical protein
MEEQLKQANPTLQRYLFTVTTFSKLLAMFLFILLPFVGFYLGMQYQQKVTVSTPIVSEVQKTPTPTIIPSNTMQTIQATSLDVPMFQAATWEELASNSSNVDLTTVFVNFNKKYSFKGKYYHAIIPRADPKNSDPVGTYYATTLGKQGWVGPSTPNDIFFDGVRITDQEASGVCGQVLSMQAYRDGIIRLISYNQQFRPCAGDSSPTSEHQSVQSGEYTLFISDPTPIQTVIDLAK